MISNLFGRTAIGHDSTLKMLNAWRFLNEESLWGTLEKIECFWSASNDWNMKLLNMIRAIWYFIESAIMVDDFYWQQRTNHNHIRIGCLPRFIGISPTSTIAVHWWFLITVWFCSCQLIENKLIILQATAKNQKNN